MNLLRLKNYLNRKNIDGELVQMEGSVKTCKQASEELEVDISQIVKSLVFFINKKPFLLIVSGDRKVDKKKIKKIFDSKTCRLAEKKEVKEVTDYSVGEIPPVGVDLPIIMDKDVAQKKEIYAGGGSTHHLLRITPNEIIENNESKIKNISKKIP